MRSRCRCSMCPAIHITSRSWLRSSSTREPSDPPLRVVRVCEQNDGSPTLHALSVNRPYKVVKRQNSTPGRRARGSPFFKPSQAVGTKAVRPQLTPSRSVQRETDRPKRDRYPDAPQPCKKTEDSASNETRVCGRKWATTATRTLRATTPRPSDARAGGNPRSIANRDRLFGPTATARCPCTCVVRLRTVDCASETDDVDKLGNDPSAGSPTETLLRLLLPLDDQV